jgi:hypothetical protein
MRSSNPRDDIALHGLISAASGQKKVSLQIQYLVLSILWLRRDSEASFKSKIQLLYLDGEVLGMRVY